MVPAHLGFDWCRGEAWGQRGKQFNLDILRTNECKHISDENRQMKIDNM